jgi:hypothetical protein
MSKPATQKAASNPEIHVKALDHGYQITKTHPDGTVTEHGAGDTDDMVDHVIDHLHNAWQSVKDAAHTIKHMNPYQEGSDALEQGLEKATGSK